MKIIRIEGKCSYDGCEFTATTIACGDSDHDMSTKHPGVALYCDIHAHEVANSSRSEFIADCPNCGCMFGVN